MKIIAFTAPRYGSFATVAEIDEEHEFSIWACPDGNEIDDLCNYRVSEVELVPEVDDAR